MEMQHHIAQTNKSNIFSNLIIQQFSNLIFSNSVLVLLLIQYMLLQANKSLGLDYFICQVNTECLSSLTDATSNRPLHITPFQVDSTVEVTQGDAVYVIQHPKGQPRSVSSYTINHVLGKLCVYVFVYCIVCVCA